MHVLIGWMDRFENVKTERLSHEVRVHNPTHGHHRQFCFPEDGKLGKTLVGLFPGKLFLTGNLIGDNQSQMKFTLIKLDL